MNSTLCQFSFYQKMAFLLMLQVLVVCSQSSFAVIETYKFTEPKNKLRYQRFVDELRCPKCQNQNLSGSNSPIAKDLRRQIHRMVEAGYEDKGIRDFMVKRYGNFILYRPPIDRYTILLWFFPLILMGIALITIVIQRKKNRQALSLGPLTEVEKKRLATILTGYG